MQGVFRNVKAPNVYIREIDRSVYNDSVERSEVDTYVLVCGFANKGPILEPRRFIRFDDFIRVYGYPLNESERYFHNAANEVLGQGGTLIACRLPYDNNSYEHVTYCEYDVSNALSNVTTDFPELAEAYPEIQSYLKIQPTASKNGIMSFEQWDSLVTGAAKPLENKFVIVDITGNKYVRDDYYKDKFPKPVVKITVNGNSCSKVYNASEQSFDGVVTATSESSGFDPEKFEYLGNVTVTGTNAGDHILDLDVNACRYNDTGCEVVWEIGDPIQLTITPAQFTVNIEGLRKQYSYDGQEHSVTGFEATSDFEGFDSNKVKYNAELPVVSQTNAGRYPMGLKAFLFSYDDQNVSNVEFNVRDGELEIIQVTITVGISGRRSVVRFDNNSHAVEGFDVICDNPAFDESKLLYDGSSSIVQTNIGTYPMNLDVSKFRYQTDNNVTSCKFVIENDGQLKISNAQFMVEITGNRREFNYDGRSHTVKGYRIKCSDPGFDSTKVKYNGTVSRTETNAGTYQIRLNESEFSYNDPNSSAEFVVKRNSKLKIAEPLHNDVSVPDVEVSGSKLNILSKDKSIVVSRDCQTQVVQSSRRELSSRDEIQNSNPSWTNQYLGIVPVIVSPLNALVYQTMLSVSDARFSAYNLISSLSTVSDFSGTLSNALPYDLVNSLSTTNFETMLSSATVTTESVGKNIVETCFPQVTYDRTYITAPNPSDNLLEEYGNTLNRTYLNQIGVVVCRMYANPNNDNRIALEPVESFVGSLDPDAVDDVTGATIYIGNKINTTSRYINFFSNINFKKPSPAVSADIFTIANQTIYSMGFFESDTQDDISYKRSIVNGLEKTFGKLDDTRTVKIDLVLDAGVSNIAQYIRQFNGSSTPGKYIPQTENIESFVLDSFMNMTAYASVRQQFEQFCRYTRGGDCMFVTDSPRPLSLTGNSKIVRPSDPLKSVTNSILPKLKYIPVLNSCYAAGYAVWFMVLDKVNRMYVWVPPSVKAVGRYIYTDRVARPWYAPAGLNRGIIGDVFDISFNPKNSEAGVLYSNSWNYAINTTFSGIVQEGQRTFQIKPTALDRVNVRRLMSEIEKRVAEISRRYLYEPLTMANLAFYENDIGKYLSKVQTGQGIEEYVVIADETNNTPNTIDNNELHCTIGVRPIKSIEYIFLTFVVTNQSVNVRESTISAR